jgi:hypothetical protein
MNRDAEATNNFWAWLFQDPSLTNQSSSGSQPGINTGQKGSDITDLHRNTTTRSIAEENAMNLSNLSRPYSDSPSDPSLEISSPSHVGDLPAVQDRFHALLKRRLRAEIAQKPPLFPWESDTVNYESESEDLAAAECVPMKGWVQQIQDRLPVPMTEEFLAGLLQQCQGLVHSSLQRGAQLVNAVESLFPDESQTLNHLAGLVLTSPARSPELQSVSGYPSHYDAATPVQKMALSLLAVQEIMDSLTLAVSAKWPTDSRQIQTDYGTLSIHTLFEQQASRLKVEVQLPCGGRLQLSSPEGQSIAHRDQPGTLSAELFDVRGDRTYFLDIQFDTNDPLSFKFAVQLSS